MKAELSDAQWCFLDILVRARRRGITRVHRQEILNSALATTERYRMTNKDLNLANSALRLVVAYDDLMRRYTGPVSDLTGADNAAIDEAYDQMVAAARITLDVTARTTPPAPQEHVAGRWLPIEQADKTINHVTEFTQIGLTLKNSDTFWVRDEDGRVYEAAWSEGNNGRDYWWDWEGESPVDPVEFMPHPLDPRFATTEGSTDE